MQRRRLIFFAKLAFSIGVVALIYFKLIAREGTGELVARLGGLSWGWIAAAALMQLCAIGVSVWRWDKLLFGQGIHAPLRHLFGSFMIGRFFGAFTPGGWTGLNGYRLYDIAHHTGKTARSTATIGIEMILGQLGFGAVVVAGSLWGLEVIGVTGVLLVDAGFLGIITVAVALLARPVLFRTIANRLPPAIRTRLQTTTDAVCAYQGKGALVTQAALLAMGTHAFNNLIYVCTARALGVELGVGAVFFVSAMQILSTLLPASVNGIGLREATAVSLYTAVGVPPAVAFLVPTVGFAVEMSISAFGGLVFLSRRVGYTPVIRVDEPEREEVTHAQIENAPREAWPRPRRGIAIGLGAGLLAGVLIGVSEAALVLASGRGATDWSVPAYGAVAYGALFAVGGAGFGFVLAWSGRFLQRAAVPEPIAFGRIAALMTAVGTLAIGLFRVRRDVYHETLKLKSGEGLLVLGGGLLSAAILYVLLSAILGRLVARKPFAFMLRAWSAPAAALGLFAVAVTMSLAYAPAEAAFTAPAQRTAPAQAGNVLFVVVDTLRADHLPAYGHPRVKTPALDRLARDGVTFEHAYANASWTRPSFASLMSGRYPSSHRTTTKPDALPDGVVTLAEAMSDGGYTTLGVVTNYNVAPFFNFDQGFDHYTYLEPEFVLGASDTAAKLLLVQVLRQRIEAMRAAGGKVAPGSTYQDAQTVNRVVLDLLDATPTKPWMMFAAYMDPHDPYYPHPYDGTGYSRAANQKPKPEEADKLRALYEGEIAFWDEKFGELLAELDKRGLYDDTTIIVTSDHGEEFMEHGGFWHGTTLYDEQLRVPLFVKLPGNAQAGSVVSHWVQGIDIMPTVLRRAGLEVPEGVQGGDLWQPRELLFAEEDHEGNVLKALRMRRGGSEVKLIEANVGNPRGLQPMELYRVDQDPGELVDLTREELELLRLSVTRLEQQASDARVGRAARSEVDLAADAAAMEKLRALGYAGGD